MTSLRRSHITLVFTCVLAYVLALFGTPPASAQTPSGESAEVLKVLDAWVKALNRDDIKVVLDHIAPDAQLDSRAARGRVSREKYAEAMQNLFKSGNLIEVQHRDRKVELVDPTHATVLLTSYAITKTDRFSTRAEFKLEKRDGRWLVTELNAK
jgi:hypothetical protein